jgi:serine/threonine protein kinase
MLGTQKTRHPIFTKGQRLNITALKHTTQLSGGGHGAAQNARDIHSVVVIDKLGSGSFGSVWHVQCDNGRQYAVKAEHPNANTRCTIEHELLIYNRLAQTNTPNIASVYGWETLNDGTHVLMMDYMGRSLQRIMKGTPGRRIPLHLVGTIGVQLCMRIRDIHKSGFIHRDIKPDNAVVCDIGSGRSRIKLIDFGTVTSYKKDGGVIHIPETHNHGITGTPRFVSMWSHDGIASSRRDDMQQILYMMSYLYYGRLPWQVNTNSAHVRNLDENVTIVQQDARTARNRRIMEHKMRTTLKTLYGGMPGLEMQARAIQKLKFEQMPDYEALMKCCRSLTRLRAKK